MFIVRVYLQRLGKWTEFELMHGSATECRNYCDAMREKGIPASWSYRPRPTAAQTLATYAF